MRGTEESESFVEEVGVTLGDDKIDNLEHDDGLIGNDYDEADKLDNEAHFQSEALVNKICIFILFKISHRWRNIIEGWITCCLYFQYIVVERGGT